MSVTNSRLMVGIVHHRRYLPIFYSLRYHLFMPCIDLDEWSELRAKVWGLGERWWHWARFKRSDYLGEGDLKQAVQKKVNELGGEPVHGKVLAVVHLRYFGLYFSPVNFYYIYDEDGHWRYLLAEVSNTPWNERHYYLVPAESGKNGQNWQHAKAFHVSPFNPIDQLYCWRLKPLNEQLMVHLECHRKVKEFDATLLLQERTFNTATLLGLLARTPIMTIKVIVGIYWEAFKLWRRGATVYRHPSKQKNKNHH